MSINRRMDREDVVYLYNEELYYSAIKKKEWNNVIGSNKDGSWVSST